MKKASQIVLLLLSYFTFYAQSVDKIRLRRALTPHEIVEDDNIVLFKRLWRRVLNDLYQNQSRYANLSQGVRERALRFIRLHQWAPLVLEQAQRAESKKIVAFLQLDHNVELPGDNYGETDPIGAAKEISIICVGPLW